MSEHRVLKAQLSYDGCIGRETGSCTLRSASNMELFNVCFMWKGVNSRTPQHSLWGR